MVASKKSVVCMHKILKEWSEECGISWGNIDKLLERFRIEVSGSTSLTNTLAFLHALWGREA